MFKKIGLLLLVTGIAQAYTITHNDYTANSVVSSAGQNTNENTIVTVINGNLDNTNVTAGGLINSNLAASTLTGAKFLSNTITGSTSNTVGATAGNIQQGTVSAQDLRSGASSTSTVAASAGTTDQATAIATATVTTIGGYVVLYASTYPSCATATCTATYVVTRGGTAIAGGKCQVVLATSGETQGCYITTIDTPSAGTQNYRLTGTTSGGTGNINTGTYSLVAVEYRN